GMAISRSYHAAPLYSGAATPDRRLSHGNGTWIVRSFGLPWPGRCQRSPSPTALGSKAKRHGPFKLSHRSRFRSGRGCSERGIPICIGPNPGGGSQTPGRLVLRRGGRPSHLVDSTRRRLVTTRVTTDDQRPPSAC